MNTAYLILGVNKGDKQKNLTSAIALMNESVGTIIQCSKIYSTAPWGNKNQPEFLNQVLNMQTKLNAEELLKSILDIEKQLGRERNENKWMERTMDIDILFFNKEVIDKENLKIPHPHLYKRKFVLIPFVEIAANFVHPVLNKTVKQLLAECDDDLSVEIYKLQ